MEQVTLTFDNGPVPGITDRILDILDRTGLKTTYFVIGRNLLDPDAAACAGPPPRACAGSVPVRCPAAGAFVHGQVGQVGTVGEVGDRP